MEEEASVNVSPPLAFGLHRILSILILYLYYGVWHSKGGLEVGGGGSCIAQSPCNSIAIVWTMQVGGGQKRMNRSCIKALK